MKFSEFKRLNESRRGNKSVIEYTLLEMNLVRIVTSILETDDGGVDQKEYVTVKDLIERVLRGEIYIENPEKLYAYNWSPEEPLRIGYINLERGYCAV